MNAAHARAIRDAMAALSAPPARATVVARTDEAWLVAWPRRARCSGLGSVVVIALGCTGAAPPALSVEVEPAEVARLVAASVELTASRAGWHLLALRLAARTGCAPELARRGGFSFACRFSGAGLANGGRFAVEVEVVPPTVSVDPPAIDLGVVPAFGEHSLDVAKGELVVSGPDRERRVPVERAGTEWMVLPGGLHHLRDGSGREREVESPRTERRVMLAAGPAGPVDLEVAHVPSGVRVAPRRLSLEPGGTGELFVAVDLVAFDAHASGAVELLARTPGDAGGGSRIAIPVAASPASAIPMLVVDPAPLRVGELSVRNRKAAVRIPCRVAGPGTVRADVAVEDAAGARIDGAARRLGGVDVSCPGGGVAAVALEVELDLATLLARGPGVRRLVVTTDQAVRERRVQRVPLEVDVTGRLLASRVLAVECVAGLRYVLPLSFHGRGPVARGPLAVAVGLPAPLEGRLAGAGDGESARSPWARTREVETLPSIDGLDLAIEPALTLDLAGLTVERRLEGSWIVGLVDRATGLEGEIELALRIDPVSVLVPRIELELGPTVWTLAIRVKGAIERPFAITEVAIAGDPLAGFEPRRIPQSCAVEPGEEVVLRVAIEPPARRGGWLSRLMGRGEALVVRVATDLAGGLVIARVVPVAEGRES